MCSSMHGWSYISAYVYGHMFTIPDHGTMWVYKQCSYVYSSQEQSHIGTCVVPECWAYIGIYLHVHLHAIL